MAIDPEEYDEVAETSRLLGEELIRRAHYMDELGKRLLGRVGPLKEAALQVQMEEPGGAPTIRDALRTAKELGTFTDDEFCTRLGISKAAGRRWMQVLANAQPRPILEKVSGKSPMWSFVIR